ncbi:MAG: tetratricopeptide repeat protein [Candidatus Delongbacteria bacterium]|nr:tetratricopeptide repeat protein [Candidatus Delongbacteria bacterium]
MTKTILILCISIIFFSIRSSAQTSSAASFLLKADQFYEHGQYDSAAYYYERILSQDISDSRVYYNLGNTYFKMNQIPQAIYNLEKAHRLAPRDDQIEFNLNKARLMLTDKIIPIPKTFFIHWYEQAKNHLNLREVMLIVLLTFSLTIIMGTIMIYRRLGTTGMALFFIMISLLATEVLWLIERYQFYHHSDQAILINPETEVRVGPREEDDPAFIIHAGIQMTILQTRHQWVEIRLENGFTGWIPHDHLKML